MVIKKRGLGRGLDALLSGLSDEPAVSLTPETQEQNSAEASRASDLCYLSLNQIERGRYQPRRDMSPQALEELAESIRQQGVMQPIIVRPIAEQQYEIIAGERRWRAAGIAGLQQIPVLIRDVPDEAAIAMALIENIQRENLNPMEEAIALQRLQQEFGLTQQAVADAVGKSRSTIANLLRLMQLEDQVKEWLERGDLDMGHARALLTLVPEQQVELARCVIAEALSVRETELRVKRLQQGEPALAPKAKPPVGNAYQDLSGSLSRLLAAPVKISASAQGKGQISIRFSSAEQLEAILQHLQKDAE